MNLPDKDHFEPFYILNTLLHCVGSPDWNNFSFSNSFHRFLMHFCTSDSVKNTCWMRVGAFFGGRRGWVSWQQGLCGWLWELGKGHWSTSQKAPDFRSLKVGISAFLVQQVWDGKEKKNKRKNKTTKRKIYPVLMCNNLFSFFLLVISPQAQQIKQ